MTTDADDLVVFFLGDCSGRYHLKNDLGNQFFALDKRQHFAMGISSTIVLAAIHYLPVGWAVAIGGTLFGIFYELQQWYRKEGQPEVWDAVATALPGVVVGSLLEMFGYGFI